MNVSLLSDQHGFTQLQRRWEVPQPTASVLCVHGISEHSARYQHVGDHLASHGFDTLAFDLPGHGQSGGRRGYVQSYNDFHSRISQLVKQRQELGVPTVLLAHSLGGLIATSYLLSDNPKPDLVVLSAPALASSHSRVDHALAKLMSVAAPKLFVKRKTDPTILSRDTKTQQDYAQDPLVLHGTTGGLAQASFNAMSRVNQHLEDLTLPTYVLHGAADQLVPASGSAPLKKLPNVTYRLWPDMRHECFNEVGNQLVLDEMTDWIDSNLANSPDLLAR